jgi:hypothetical protein
LKGEICKMEIDKEMDNESEDESKTKVKMLED